MCAKGCRAKWPRRTYGCQMFVKGQRTSLILTWWLDFYCASLWNMTFSDLLASFRAALLETVGHIFDKQQDDIQCEQWKVICADRCIHIHGNSMPQIAMPEMRPRARGKVRSLNNIWVANPEPDRDWEWIKWIHIPIFFFANLMKEKQNDFTTPNLVDRNVQVNQKYL